MMHRIAIVLASALGATSLAGGPVAAAHAKPAVVLGDPDVIADVAEKVTPSVVNVWSTQVVQTGFEGDPFFEEFFGRRGGKRKQGGGGSGVIVSSKGFVITNN